MLSIDNLPLGKLNPKARLYNRIDHYTSHAFKPNNNHTTHETIPKNFLFHKASMVYDWLLPTLDKDDEITETNTKLYMHMLICYLAIFAVFFKDNFALSPGIFGNAKIDILKATRTSINNVISKLPPDFYYYHLWYDPHKPVKSNFEKVRINEDCFTAYDWLIMICNPLTVTANPENKNYFKTAITEAETIITEHVILGRHKIADNQSYAIAAFIFALQKTQFMSEYSNEWGRLNKMIQRVLETVFQLVDINSDANTNSIANADFTFFEPAVQTFNQATLNAIHNAHQVIIDTQNWLIAYQAYEQTAAETIKNTQQLVL